MSLYGLPFDGIKGIRESLGQFRQAEAGFMEEFRKLREEFTKEFGYKLPIRLVKVKNRSYQPFVWRDMTGDNTQVRKLAVGGLFGELGQGVLAHLPAGRQRLLLDIERRRQMLGYAIGMVQYQIVRLERLEADFIDWRNVMRDLGRH